MSSYHVSCHVDHRWPTFLFYVAKNIYFHQTTEWKQYEIIRLNVNHNITIFLYKINFKIIKYLLFCYRIENREFEWEFPTFLSKFGFIGFIGLMEIQCMYVRVHAARIRERKGDRLEPQASRYPRISGRAVYSLQPTIL